MPCCSWIGAGTHRPEILTHSPLFLANSRFQTFPHPLRVAVLLLWPRCDPVDIGDIENGLILPFFLTLYLGASRRIFLGTGSIVQELPGEYWPSAVRDSVDETCAPCGIRNRYDHQIIICLRSLGHPNSI